jgi:hypothetical protein
VTVTNTGSGAGGYLQVWPTGAVQPTSSTLNYPGGRGDAGERGDRAGGDVRVDQRLLVERLG